MTIPESQVRVLDRDSQGKAAKGILAHNVVQTPYHLLLVLMRWHLSSRA